MVDVIRQGARFPVWSNVKSFSLHEIGPQREEPVAVTGPRARLLVTSGGCQMRQGARSQVLREGQFVALEPGEAVFAASNPAQAVVFEGDWGDELGGCGLFRAENMAAPADRGDPVSYPKHTNIDAHYHDCQEFWLLLEGAATVVVDSQHLQMRPGDCLPIPMGAMHDMPDAPQPVKAVYFETTLRGLKRTGHLWQHTHGPAVREEASL
jgi:mannose-6-phosphate isomerase-like protein (cupin superfamily)